jgi:putative acetyltransferase
MLARTHRISPENEMKRITVRSENTSDIKAIDVVNLSAFEGDDEARFVAELRKLPGYNSDFSLVAEFNGRIVGHLMLTPVVLRTSAGEIKVLALAPMSVVPSQSHRGIGTELVRTAMERAESMGFGAIIVAGHPDYYARLGFEPAARWNITSNLPVPGEAFMAREVIAGTLREGGRIEYPQPFLAIY